MPNPLTQTANLQSGDLVTLQDDQSRYLQLRIDRPRGNTNPNPRNPNLSALSTDPQTATRFCVYARDEEATFYLVPNGGAWDGCFLDYITGPGWSGGYSWWYQADTAVTKSGAVGSMLSAEQVTVQPDNSVTMVLRNQNSNTLEVAENAAPGLVIAPSEGAKRQLCPSRFPAGGAEQFTVFTARKVGTIVTPTSWEPDALSQAKLTWLRGVSNFPDMPLGTSALIGVEKDGKVFAVAPNSSLTAGSVVGGVIITKTIAGPSFHLIGSASVLSIANNEAVNGIDAVDVNIFEAQAGLTLDAFYAGAGAGFTLAGGSASIFDFNLGIGVDTGIGLKDDSIELEFAGTGVTIGQKMSISVLDNSFGIDLVRTANAAWFTGQQLAVAIAIVPGALSEDGNLLVQELKSLPGAFGDSGHEFVEGAGQLPGAIEGIPGLIKEAFKDV